MPGTGIENFNSHAKAIAKAGIYDFAAHHEQILVPCVLRQWKLDELTGLDAEAEQARDRTIKHIDRVGRAARRATDRRAELAGLN
jgi:acyl-[acyl-carrier-protein] desaturase